MQEVIQNMFLPHSFFQRGYIHFRFFHLSSNQHSTMKPPKSFFFWTLFVATVVTCVQILLITKTLPMEHDAALVPSEMFARIKKEETPKRQIYSVFSTGCSPGQDWQSHVLAYSHKLHKIPGKIIRLMACNDPSYQLPHHSYEVVRTPDWTNKNGDVYSPRNRPYSLSYWLNGIVNSSELLPNDNDVIINIDPDMVFLNGHLHVDLVQHGHGVAAQYALGNMFLKDMKRFCGGACEFDKKPTMHEYSMGTPYLLTALDAKRHANLWGNITDEIRFSGHSGWETEMFSAILTFIILGIKIHIEQLMHSDHSAWSENWELVKWHPNLMTPTSLLVGHYCQIYEISTFSWYKKSKEMEQVDLRKCGQNLLLDTPTIDVLEMMERRRKKPLVRVGKESSKSVRENRNVWLLDNTYSHVKQALGSYYEEFCTDQ